MKNILLLIIFMNVCKSNIHANNYTILQNKIDYSDPNVFFKKIISQIKDVQIDSLYSLIEEDKKPKKSDFKDLIMKISVLLKKETVSKPCNEVTNNISFQNGNSIQSVNYSKEIIIPPYILHKRVKPLIYSTDYIIEDVIEINVLKKNSHWSLKSINLVTNELSKDYNLKHFISNYFKEANNIDYYFGKSDEKLSVQSNLILASKDDKNNILNFILKSLESSSRFNNKSPIKIKQI